MDQRLRSFYLESKVNGTSSGELLVMLYSTLVEQAEDAEQELAAPAPKRNVSHAAKCVARCIDILTELDTALKHDVDPDLCGTLTRLYAYFTRQFSDALSACEPGKIRTILPLLRDLKAAWSQAHKLSTHGQPLSLSAV
jgi:flagellar biosynthetic protein FliS